jgi:hypothetical protein
MAVVIEELQAEVSAPPAAPPPAPAPAQNEAADERKVLEAVARDLWRGARLVAD